MAKLAVYPGSFDPFHNGHLDILFRGLGVFDKIVVAIGINPEKSCLFSLEERVALIKESIKDYPRITCDTFESLLVDYASRVGASAILRGLRAVSDFEYEFQLSLMNRKLNRSIETHFLMTAHRYLYVSSKIIKATIAAGGRPKGLVPDHIFDALVRKFT